MNEILAQTAEAVSMMNRIVLTEKDAEQLAQALEQPAKPSEALTQLFKGEQK